jgi:predicted amino acid dehydrogenase
VISAEAILKSKSGRSLARACVPITAENVEDFAPAAKTIAEAMRHFRELGFAVTHAGMTLTLVGKPVQFEKVFGVKLALKKHRQTGDMTVMPDRGLVIPDSLKDFVEEVVFPEPPEFFP